MLCKADAKDFKAMVYSPEADAFTKAFGEKNEEISVLKEFKELIHDFPEVVATKFAAESSGIWKGRSVLRAQAQLGGHIDSKTNVVFVVEK